MINSHQNIWAVIALVFVQVLIQVTAEVCTDGSSCLGSEFCCTYESGCCTNSQKHYYYNSWSIWNMWYFWFIIIFVLLSCFGGCGYWRRRQWALQQQRRMAVPIPRGGQPQPGVAPATLSGPAMYAYDFGAQPMYMPPPNPQDATFQSPPAYTEVISKPAEYPPNKNDCPPYPGFVLNDQATQYPYPTQAAMPAPVAPPSYTMMPSAAPAEPSAVVPPTQPVDNQPPTIRES